MKKKIQSTNLSVGDVANRSGVKVSTLHFYEEKALIHANRNAGNQRRYNRDVLRRIAVIKAAQKVGISLSEIQRALSFLPKDKAPSKSDWQHLSKQWKKTLEHKIQQLTVLRDEMSSCIGCGCLSLTACPLYNPEDKLGEKQTGPVLLNQKTVSSD